MAGRCAGTAFPLTAWSLAACSAQGKLRIIMPHLQHKSSQSGRKRSTIGTDRALVISPQRTAANEPSRSRSPRTSRSPSPLSPSPPPKKHIHPQMQNTRQQCHPFLWKWTAAAVSAMVLPIAGVHTCPHSSPPSAIILFGRVARKSGLYVGRVCRAGRACPITHVPAKCPCIQPEQPGSMAVTGVPPCPGPLGGFARGRRRGCRRRLLGPRGSRCTHETSGWATIVKTLFCAIQ